ncbi:MAG: FkbM family methyltransferase [Verrucomicrobiaceae bacterium]
MTFTQLVNAILAPSKRQLIKVHSNIVYEHDWVMDARRRLADKKEGVIIDIGANCGQTTKRLARAFPSFDIHCLEPNAELHEKIRERAGFHKNLTIHRLGAGLRDEELAFHKSSKHESNSFRKDWSHRHGTPVAEEIVPVCRLDTFCTKHHIDTISVLKTNAEGFDYQILEGAAPLLAQKKILCLIVEVSFGSLGEESARPGSFLNLMEGHGYQFLGLYETARNKTTGGIKWGNMLFAA